jgi:hypothetical protein
MNMGHGGTEIKKSKLMKFGGIAQVTPRLPQTSLEVTGIKVPAPVRTQS